MRTLRIDPDFCQYLGRASQFSDAELERQLIAGNGPREPIYVWAGHGVILDGHRRYAICRKHKLEYPVVEIDLPSKEAARDWMDRHQFCRRNVSPADEARHVARLVANGEGTVKARVAEVAKKTGKTERTVFRDLNYVDDLNRVVPEVRQRIESGEMPLAKKAMHSLATLTPEQQRDAVSQVDKGEFRTLKGALLGEKPGDTMSPTPKKPREDYFRDIIRALGQFKKMLGDLNAMFPDDQYKTTVSWANAISKALQTWKAGE